MSEYYKFPLNFNELFKKNELPKCSDIGESISLHINLIITSKFGEYRFDPEFGSNIWDRDFENIGSNDDWSNRVSGALKSIIVKYEPRLKGVSVVAEISQEEIFDSGSKGSALRVKQRVIVTVEGALVSTNERFETTQRLFISPLSYD